ncbi:LysM peptidoglycan-binding domain-containing protein [Haloferula sp. BvORR071]|uniref:LysM peptidoglycan-binding domain-containing protein n=1 Tax=Haloferula sp. BvORR071 TaxID=1396141 RepID=UPI000695D6B8|nr:LysM peptidoglycan-binding domain-containing protein [Haloferula sp. BvORR071]
MQLRWFYLPAALVSVILCSCKSTGGGGGGSTPGSTGVGPFDARGNYVEAWADSPSKWRKGSTQVVDAQPDREAANVPVVPEPVPPPTLAANERPKPVSTTTTRVYKNPDGTVSKTKPKATASSGSASSKSKSKPVVVKPKTTPNKEVASKSKTKAKPKSSSSRYTVKSGDNLNSIAKRYGTTASAVQKANGLKSTNSIIRPGQSLTIPK